MPGVNGMIDQGIAPQPGGVLLGNVAYIPPGFEGLYKEPFTYNVIFNPLTASTTATQSTQIQNDSWFVCTSQVATIWDAATQRTTNLQPNVAPILCRLFDSSSGKFSMDQPTPIGNQFGTASQPFVWLYRARVYYPGGQLAVELTDQTTVNQTVRLSFIGFKVYNVADRGNS